MESLATQYSYRTALLDTLHTLSYEALRRRMNQYARWATAQGLGPGDVVGLLMPNCIDYTVIWLGLTRVGCTVALLNTHVRGDALLQCIHAASARGVIVSERLPADQYDLLAAQHTVWKFNDTALAETEYSSAPITLPLPRPQDCALLIYTSGTTGLPKATRITHRRIVEWSYWFAGMMDAQPEDRLYNCLPMYHSIGGVVAIGSMLVKGGSVFIRERFSASHFWGDVHLRECTIFQYIGELCRFLLLAEPHPLERSHRLRLACGNGLQGDVWEQFQHRFGIPRILEFYAASEGNLSLYNCDGKPGAIGRVPAVLAGYFPIAIIRCNPETGTVLRDANGHCVVCSHDEPGEAISRIGNGREFDGYTDPDASQRKVLRDVFVVGDRWFRSGDLMRKDANGYFYFVDRLGDTFRWKGENVSTTQVATVLRGCTGIVDAVVYGVAVPGHDGRAGMAAITVDAQFDFAVLYAHLAANLPEYACPMFIRICDSLDTTGTFKLTKTALARDGFAASADPVWRRDRATGNFQPMTVN